jgi:hypothetical protein
MADRTGRARQGLRLSVADRYDARFGEMPPVRAWQGSWAGLERRMRESLRTGRRLTESRLDRVQGLAPPPPGADW